MSNGCIFTPLVSQIKLLRNTQQQPRSKCLVKNRVPYTDIVAMLLSLFCYFDFFPIYCFLIIYNYGIPPHHQGLQPVCSTIFTSLYLLYLLFQHQTTLHTLQHQTILLTVKQITLLMLQLVCFVTFVFMLLNYFEANVPLHCLFHLYSLQNINFFPCSLYAIAT